MAEKMLRAWRSIEQRPYLSATFFVCIALLVSYENIVFRGQTLVATANSHPFDNRADRLRPTDVKQPAFVNWSDPGGSWWIWEPAGRFFSTAFKKRILPRWNPTIGGGVDAHVDVTSSQYFPPYDLLLLAGDSPLGRDIYYLLLLLLSGTATAFLALRNGFHLISAAAMGILYALSGAMTQTINSILGQSFAVIPLVVLVCDWLVERPTARRVGVFALTIGFAITTSFLPAVISGFFMLPFLVIADGVARRKIDLRTIGGFCTGIALGLGLAAFLLIPLQIVSGATPEFQTWYSTIGLMHYGWRSLITIVSPQLIYDVWQHFDPQKELFPEITNFFYIGLLPLLLLPFIRTDREIRKQKLLVFFLATAAALLLKLMGVPPAQWLGYLPVFKTLHFIPYFCAALTFAMTGLAGIAIESIIREPPRRATYEITVILALLFFAAVSYALLNPVNEHGDARRNVADLVQLAFLSIIFLRIIRLRLKQRLAGATAGILILALILIELGMLAHRQRFLRSDIWTNVPSYVAFLQRDRGIFRVHGTAFPANVNEALGLYSISSRDVFTPVRFTNLLRRYFKTAPLPYPVADSILPANVNVLDMLNVKYLVAASADEQAMLEKNGFARVHVDGVYHVFQNAHVWPRAYVANRWEVRPPKEAMERIVSLERPDQVILEQQPPVAASAAPKSPPRVKAVDYSYNRAEFDVRSERPALFVLLDNYSPGWRARVNGADANILIANYAFRAVAIPAGVSHVVFEYQLPGLSLGLLLSAMSGLAILILIARSIIASKIGVRRTTG